MPSMTKASSGNVSRQQKNLEGLSFITMQDLSPETLFIFVSDSVTDLLGWEPQELVGKSVFEIIHPEELKTAEDVYYDTVQTDKAATVGYLRFKCKDDSWKLCLATWTVAHNAVISSVSLATEGPRSMLRASTAQDVMIFTPSAADKFDFKKWSSGAYKKNATALPVRVPGAIPFTSLPTPSVRQALVLNRFSIAAPVLFCTNATILDPELVGSRSFYDFVSEKDEPLVRNWINVTKGGGIEAGVKGEGGFGYGRFSLCLKGRESGGRTKKKGAASQSRTAGGPSARSTEKRGRRGSIGQVQEGELEVEAIFSAHSDGLIIVLRQAST